MNLPGSAASRSSLISSVKEPVTLSYRMETELLLLKMTELLQEVIAILPTENTKILEKISALQALLQSAKETNHTYFS
jgi:glutamate/tyrosine decarboxylase-like PLP-dependent enzyme